jgi:formate-dependent nitrite reductase membrane component NrfD
MIWKSDTGGLMFKPYSAISIGIWIITVFVIFIILASAAALADVGILPRPISALGEGAAGKIIALGCVILGASVAGYTGLVLTDTNRPLWSDTVWITLLFLLSGISAGGAAMVLFGWRQTHPGSVRWIEQMEGFSSIVELIVLAIVAATIWTVVSVVWSGVWAAVLLVGVVLLGILIPLILYARPRLFGASTIPVAALLVLLGSFLLRTVVILSSEAV